MVRYFFCYIKIEIDSVLQSTDIMIYLYCYWLNVGFLVLLSFTAGNKSLIIHETVCMYTYNPGIISRVKILRSEPDRPMRNEENDDELVTVWKKRTHLAIHRSPNDHLVYRDRETH